MPADPPPLFLAIVFAALRARMLGALPFATPRSFPHLLLQVLDHFINCFDGRARDALC
jgi:hypothetical protein